MSMIRGRCALLAIFASGFLAACSSDDDGGGVAHVAVVAMAPAEIGPRANIDATVEVTTGNGAPVRDAEVVFTVRRGGGTLGASDEPRVVTSTVRSDADGRASVPWTVGIAPVGNRLTASAGDEAVAFETRVVLAEPLQPEPFGDIPEFLRENGYTAVDDEGQEVFLASTEDLAFVSDDRVVLGLAAGTSTVTGALIEMNPAGEAALVDLEGEPLIGALGVAVDRDGVIWVADPRGPAPGALLRISTDGVVETALTAIADVDLIAPNYVAVGPDGRIYVSDPCLGEIFRYDPVTAEVDALVTMDVATQGGPNGLAFDRSGDHLYFATESIALLCMRFDLPPLDPVAGLFRVPVDAAGFGEVETIAERRALFGDGLAFDDEDNLYVIFDTQDEGMLEESAVWVLPAGETELVKFLANGERVYANLAWGRGGFGAETLYISLLAINEFNLPIRGIDRIDLGIAGLPLLP